MSAVAPIQGRDALTYLFVPGDRPERFQKALDTGTDVVIIDLEDSVAPGNAGMALENAVAAITSPSKIQALIRVHSATTELFKDELSAIADAVSTSESGLLGLVLAKAETAEHIAEVVRRLPVGSVVIPLIESAVGLLRAYELAAVPGVARLAFGAVDFSLDIGGASTDDDLSYARSHLVVASRAARVTAPVDSPSLNISDTSVVEHAARRAKSRGFGGMLAIHPAQLAPIRRGFSPSDEEVRWAREVLEVEGGAAQVHGRLVDRPVFDKAHAILNARKEQK
ncbi:MAG: putative citrate lyase beta subunit [Frondihabitans sp.]|nr:putative citrate lyase beta subunit [Frondihabitans sp.]